MVLEVEVLGLVDAVVVELGLVEAVDWPDVLLEEVVPYVLLELLGLVDAVEPVGLVLLVPSVELRSVWVWSCDVGDVDVLAVLLLDDGVVELP